MQQLPMDVSQLPKAQQFVSDLLHLPLAVGHVGTFNEFTGEETMGKTLMRTKMSKLALALGLIAAAGATMAATDTANLTVNATVQNACAIGPGTLGFGNVSMAVNAGAGTAATTAAANADSGTSVKIVCTTGSSATVTGGNGSNYSSGRRMKMAATADYLGYELYTSSARTTVLDTTTGSIAYTGTGADDSVTIYGQITAANLAAAKAGAYSDTVALIVTYAP
jgi:spore coat protein U-like protein